MKVNIENLEEMLDFLWKAYRVFSDEASQTETMNSDSAPDFIAWLERNINFVNEPKFPS